MRFRRQDLFLGLLDESIEKLRGRLEEAQTGKPIAKVDKSPGDELITCVRRRLLYGMEYSIYQEQFLHVLNNANIPNIYQEEYRFDEARIKRRNCVTNIPVMTLISLPRRSGKSVGLANWAAISIVTLRKFDMVICGPFRRQTSLFMKIMDGAFERVGKYIPFRVERHNTEVVHIRTAEGYLNTIQIIPGKSDSTRGISANCVILEEMAYFSEDFVTTVVFPLMQMEGCVVVGISSMNNQANFFARLMNFTHPKESVRKMIQTIKFMSVCSSCIKLGIAYNCDHMSHLIPKWQSAQNIDFVRAMYIYLGKQSIMEQEIGGVSHADKEPCFNVAQLNRLFLDDGLTDKQMKDIFGLANASKPKVIFCAVDPTGGGTTSDLAVSSGWLNPETGDFIFLGGESIPLQDPEQANEYAICHLQELKKIPGFHNALLVVCIEGNLPALSITLANRLIQKREVFPVQVPNKIGKEISDYVLQGSTTARGGRFQGLAVLNQLKLEMKDHFIEKLKYNHFMFYRNFVTCFRPERQGMDHMSASHMIRQDMKSQLLSYAYHWKEPKDVAFGISQYSLSGKAPGQKDDLAMVAQACPYWASQWWENPEWLVFQQNARWW